MGPVSHWVSSKINKLTSMGVGKSLRVSTEIHTSIHMRLISLYKTFIQSFSRLLIIVFTISCSSSCLLICYDCCWIWHYCNECLFGNLKIIKLSVMKLSSTKKYKNNYWYTKHSEYACWLYFFICHNHRFSHSWPMCVKTCSTQK